MPSPVKPANSISATSSGFTQWTSAALRGAPGPVNGLSSVSSAFSLRQQAGDLVAAEARADPADIDQLAVAVDADEQRAEAAARRRSSRRSPPRGRRGTWP